MIYILQIVLAGINISMAAYHAKLIKSEKKINHGLWAAGYLAVAVWLSLWVHSWWLMILSLFIRKVVFDLSLNLFLKRQLFFVSTETTSLIDKWHYKLFGKRSEIYMSIYCIVIIVINILR